jgi:hypothetical protein
MDVATLASYHSLRNVGGIGAHTFTDVLTNPAHLLEWLYVTSPPALDDHLVVQCYRLWCSVYLQLGDPRQLGMADLTPGPAGLCGVCCRLPPEGESCARMTAQQYVEAEERLQAAASSARLVSRTRHDMHLALVRQFVVMLKIRCL